MQFEFVKWLQDYLGCKLVIQITDDEKFLRGQNTWEEIDQFARLNIQQIWDFGFDPERTLVFRNSEASETLRKNTMKIQRKINLTTLKSTFGFKDSDSVGQVAFPVSQMSPAFASSFPGFIPESATCIIPCGADQDPYFRLCRDVAPKLGEKKPALIFSGFLPDLKTGEKMSSSKGNTGVSKRAKSGGRETLEEHRRLGAVIDQDVPMKWLKIFLESDEELEEIERTYSAGEMTSGEVKKILVNVVLGN